MLAETCLEPCLLRQNLNTFACWVCRIKGRFLFSNSHRFILEVAWSIQNKYHWGDRHYSSSRKDIRDVYSLPETFFADNGPPFEFQEFQTFCLKNGIEHSVSPPYHSQSNGSRTLISLSGNVFGGKVCLRCFLDSNDGRRHYFLSACAVPVVCSSESLCWWRGVMGYLFWTQRSIA